MAPYRRAAISGRGSPRYQARFGHSTLVSWQLIVENEPTGRFVSRPRDRVTLIVTGMSAAPSPRVNRLRYSLA